MYTTECTTHGNHSSTTFLPNYTGNNHQWWPTSHILQKKTTTSECIGISYSIPSYVPNALIATATEMHDSILHILLLFYCNMFTGVGFKILSCMLMNVFSKVHTEIYLNIWAACFQQTVKTLIRLLLRSSLIRVYSVCQHQGLYCSPTFLLNIS